MEQDINIQGEEMQQAQLELLMKIVGSQSSMYAAINYVLGRDNDWYRVYDKVQKLADDIELPDAYEYKESPARAIQNYQLFKLAEILAAVTFIRDTMIESITNSAEQASIEKQRADEIQMQKAKSILYELQARQRNTLNKLL